MGYLPPSCVTAPRAAGCRSPVELDLTITGNPESSCSVASGRVAYCLGTASGSEGFDRASALRELVEEQGPVVPQCWGMSPELDSLAWQVFYSGSRCTGRRRQDRFRIGWGLGPHTARYITRSLLVGLASITERSSWNRTHLLEQD
jgi:hypothetical protein